MKSRVKWGRKASLTRLSLDFCQICHVQRKVFCETQLFLDFYPIKNNTMPTMMMETWVVITRLRPSTDWFHKRKMRQYQWQRPRQNMYGCTVLKWEYNYCQKVYQLYQVASGNVGHSKVMISTFGKLWVHTNHMDLTNLMVEGLLSLHQGCNCSSPTWSSLLPVAQTGYFLTYHILFLFTYDPEVFWFLFICGQEIWGDHGCGRLLQWVDALLSLHHHRGEPQQCEILNLCH